MYRMYAADPRARINLGIRRRLAPLLENDRRPHQADEQPAAVDAGLADPLLRRRDRHGRQHLPRRPQRRAHADAVDGPTATPASRAPTRSGSTCRRSWTRSTATRRSTSRRRCASRRRCCNWTRRMLAVRSGTRRSAAARSRSCSPGNRKILAYLREYGDEVDPVRRQPRRARRSRSSSTCARFKGRVPVELMGRTPFPPIGELPYLLTLPATASSGSGSPPTWTRRRGTTSGCRARSCRCWCCSTAGTASSATASCRGASAMAEKVRAQLEREAAAALRRGAALVRGEGRAACERVALRRPRRVGQRRRRRWLIALAASSAARRAATLLPAAGAGLGGRRRGAHARARAGDRRQGAAAGERRRPRRRVRRRGVLPRAGRGDRRRRASCDGARGTLRFAPTDGVRGASPATDLAALPVALPPRAEQQHGRRARRAPVPQGYRRLQAGHQSGARDRPLPDRGGAASRNCVPVAGASNTSANDGRVDDARAAAGATSTNQGDGWDVHAGLPRALPRAVAGAERCAAAGADVHGGYLALDPHARHAHRRAARGACASGPAIRPSIPSRSQPATSRAWTGSAHARRRRPRSSARRRRASRRCREPMRADATRCSRARERLAGAHRRVRTGDRRGGRRRASTATITWARCCWCRTIS